MSSQNEGFTDPEHEALAAKRDPALPETFRLTDADLAGLPAVAELDEPSPDIPWDHPLVVAALERLAVAYTVFRKKETAE